MCFGKEGIEINLGNFGNIILIRGINMDIQASDDEERYASNGVGKSAVAEILVYGLFGKTIKHPKKVKHENCVNNQIKKGLKVEIELDNLKIVRTRKPDSLRIWQFGGVCPPIGKVEEWKTDDWNEISLGGIPATQEWLESTIKLTYESFVNLVVFTDNNAGSFLELENPKKREIVENLLSLERYRTYCDKAKELKNEANSKVKDHARVLELAIAEFESSKRRIAKIEQQQTDWKATKQQELGVLVNKIKNKQEQLKSTDTGAALSAYNNAVEKIAEHQLTLTTKEEKLTKINDTLEEANKKLEENNKLKNKIEISLNSLNSDLNRSKNTIKDKQSFISNIESQRCKNCNFADENGIKLANNIIDVENLKIVEVSDKISKENEELNRYNILIIKVNEMISVGKNKSRETVNEINLLKKEITELSKVEKPIISVNEKIIEEQILELKNQALSKKDEIDGPSPFAVIMEEALKESDERSKDCEIKKEELNEANKKLPYYEFWVKGFGEFGIRKFIIDGIIPALNNRIAYWLQFLIDGKISLSFDNELSETIERNPSDGDPFVYHAMSGGERRRLNLAVSQAFAHIMMLNTGTSPSVVFLDEVTTNVDQQGVQGIYNMILELAKEKQVFVTTHDQGLIDLLIGCETINLKKENGFTTLAN